MYFTQVRGIGILVLSQGTGYEKQTGKKKG
jgi:hypothetical protein